MRPDDRIRVRHMLDAMEAAMRFVSGRSRTDLAVDEELVFALMHAVQIVGEAASRLTPAARAGMPDVPWAAILGMRNRLVHAYFEVDLDILWETATRALPDLHARLKPVVQ